MKAVFRKTALAAAAVCVMGLAAAAAHASTSFPVTQAQRQAAEKAAQQGVDISELAPDAPSVYIVKQGDTLWGISGLFLRSPWRWPALWGMNLNEVNNPHKIYPGEKLHLEIIAGKAVLTKQPGQGDQVIQLSPHVRVVDQLSAISTISIDKIGPFLTRPMLVDDAAFASSGVVMGTEDGRLNVGSGGKIYASNLSAQAKVGDKYTIYRAGREIVDPDTGEQIGKEAVYLGEAVVAKPGQGDQTMAMLKVSSSVQEVGRGDRMLSIPADMTFQFAPRAPGKAVSAKIAMIHDGRSGSSLIGEGRSARSYDAEGGALSIVVINRGESAGLAPGHVLQLSSKLRTIAERSTFGFRNGDRVKAPVQYPSEQFGSVMVFKAFSNISYGIVLEASEPVSAGDLASSEGAK